MKRKIDKEAVETAHGHDVFLLYKVKENMFSVQKAMKENPEFKEAVEKYRSKEMTKEELTPFLRKYVLYHGKLIDYSRFDEDGNLK